MPIKNKQLKLSLARNYPALVRQVKAELDGLEFFVRRKTTESYWKIGKFIHTHLLDNKERAGYGLLLYESLEEDVGKDKSTLRRTVQFYLTYPILAPGRELQWSHYRQLITIKDEGQRKQLEEQFINKGFDVRKSQAYLNFKKSQLSAKEDPDKPVTQLSFTRGKLFIYKVIEVVDAESKQTSLRLDLGFKVGRPINEDFHKDDFVEVKGPNEESSLVEASVCALEIFTYKASVLKVVDGDTLTVDMDTGLNEFIGQKLRLRGIDCPEMDTEEGKRAKRFVESRLKACEFIIVKTYKDRSDMWDRYLADVFYLADEEDPHKLAQQGTYLNQELLDKGLARLWE